MIEFYFIHLSRWKVFSKKLHSEKFVLLNENTFHGIIIETD